MANSIEMEDPNKMRNTFKMQNTIKWLGGLLALQLVLAIGLYVATPDIGNVHGNTPFVALGGHKVDRITIEDGDGKRIELTHDGDHWVLPDTSGFPADDGKVERLLAELTGLKRGLAVATTMTARQRMKVADDDFERRITLAQGDDKLATLYFGTSPGVRRVHARSAGDDDIYAADFGLFDAPVKAEDWEDQSLLRIPQKDIAAIDVASLKLTRHSAAKPATPAAGESADLAPAASWQAASLKDGETLDQTHVDALAQRLADLSTGAVLGTADKPEYGMAQPALAFSVERNGAATVEYRIGKQGDDYTLKRSDRAEYFRLPDYAAKALIDASARDQLVSSSAGDARDAATAQEKATAPAMEGSDHADNGKSKDSSS